MQTIKERPMLSAQISLSKKIAYLALANLFFFVHLAIILINGILWLFPSLFYIFLPTIIITILTEIFWGSCFLSNWEFNLRRKVNPGAVYAPSFITHYTYKFLGIGKTPAEANIQKKAMKGKMFSLMLFLILSLGLLFKLVIFVWYLVFNCVKIKPRWTISITPN